MRSATRRGGLLAGVTLSALMIAVPAHAAGLSLGGIGGAVGGAVGGIGGATGLGCGLSGVGGGLGGIGDGLGAPSLNGDSGYTITNHGLERKKSALSRLADKSVSFDCSTEPRQRAFQVVIADIRQCFGNPRRRRRIGAAGRFAIAVP